MPVCSYAFLLLGMFADVRGFHVQAEDLKVWQHSYACKAVYHVEARREALRTGLREAKPSLKIAHKFACGFAAHYLNCGLKFHYF